VYLETVPAAFVTPLRHSGSERATQLGLEHVQTTVVLLISADALGLPTARCREASEGALLERVLKMQTRAQPAAS